jgi:predicted ATPase
MVAPTLRRVQVRGLRRLADLELNFTGPDGRPVRQFVLAGPNGSGKTTALEAILFGLGQDALLKRDKEHRRWAGGFPTDASVEIELQRGDAIEIWRRTREGFHGPGGNTGAHGPSGVSVEYFSSWRAPILVGPLQPLGRARRPNDNETNRIWRLKQRLIDEISRRSFSGTSRESTWLNSLNRAWSRLHGNDGTSLDVQLVDESSDDAYADLFVVSRGRRICAADELSSGELELLSVAGWLVTSGMSEGILVIDEPELHLHPQWQSTFLPALREIAPQLQLVVSTHSDAPWLQAQPWERALLVDETDPRSQQWRLAHEASDGDV